MNFENLLFRLNELSEVAEEISQQDFEKLVGDVADKIDSIRFVLSHFEAESDRLKKIIDEFAKAKKTVDNSFERLKGYVIYSMKNNNMPYLEGEKFTVKLTQSEATETKGECDEKTYLKFLKQNISVVKKSFQWDKTEIKRLLKSDQADLVKDIAEIKINNSVKFSPKKGV